MNKKILTNDEVKVLDTINVLQEKINEITYIDGSFEEIMERHFENVMNKKTPEELVRLRITLFNLEELNLIEGDVLKSPRITEEGKEILDYYKERNSILYGTIGAIIILSATTFAYKIVKKIFN